MESLYFLLLYPLELFYRYTYLFLVDISGSFDLGLLWLSLVSFFLFKPLKGITAKVQQKEVEIQEILSKQIQRIKAESKGAERQARINALYKRYSYHPLYGMRLSLGILLQVPFLCAAYYMLGSLPELQGQPAFGGIIADLGKADSLLGSVNALPLLMTAVNLVCVYITPNFGHKQKQQGVIVALLFLLTLYSSPSALLVYWTGNNVLSTLEVIASRWGKLLLPQKPSKKIKTYSQQSLFLQPDPANARFSPGAWLRRVYRFEKETELYVVSALLLVFIVFVYSPLALLDSGAVLPDGHTAFHMVVLPYALLALLFFTMLRLHTPKNLRPALTFALLYGSLATFFYSTTNFVDYGSLDATLLANDKALQGITAKIIDTALLSFLAFFLICLLHKKKTRFLFLAMSSSIAALFFYVAISLYATENNDHKQVNFEENASATSAGDSTPDGPFFSFSKTENNVAIFFLDMFTGGHIEDIFAQYPELQARFQGFAWFPDTVAVSMITSGSAPSLYGGEKYLPPALDARPDDLLIDKFSEALAVFAQEFIAKGFHVTYQHNGYDLNPSYFTDFLKTNSLRFVDIPRQKALSLYGPILQEKSSEVPFFFLLGAFKSSPYILKRYVYDNANWLDTAPIDGQLAETAYNVSKLANLPKFSAVDSKAPTLNYFYSLLPHIPWHLAPDSLALVKDPYPRTKGNLTKVDGIIPEHYYTEVHTLHFLADFFDWLKAHDIYDNTKIILVSDHCEADSRMLNRALGVAEKGDSNWNDNLAFSGRPHALLMVKDFNAGTGFRISPSLMATSDIPALACEAIGGCREISAQAYDAERIRYHYHGFESWQQIEVKDKKVYDPYDTTEIRGSMFKKENWFRKK